MTSRRLHAFYFLVCLVLTVSGVRSCSGSSGGVADASFVSTSGGVVVSPLMQSINAVTQTDRGALTGAAASSGASESLLRQVGAASSSADAVIDESSTTAVPSTGARAESPSPPASTALSSGGWAGLGVTVGVLVTALVALLIYGVAKCCGCCCFRAGPVGVLTSSSPIATASSPPRRRGFEASVPPAASSSHSLTSSSRPHRSGSRRRRTHSAPPTDCISTAASKTGSLDSAEAAESSSQTSFRQSDSVTPALAEQQQHHQQPALEMSLTHGHDSVYHHMMPVSPGALNPLSPGAAAPAIGSSRSPSPYMWGILQPSPAPVSPQTQQPLSRTHKMSFIDRPAQPLHRRSSSVTFVGLNEEA